MASGKAHAIATVAAGIVAPPIAVLWGGVPLAYGAAIAAGCFVGLVITPDLDIRRFTHAHEVVRRLNRQLGWLLALLWFGFWWPYARLIPRHRHPLSHLPVLGTALRLLYLGAVYLLFYWLFNLIFVLDPLAWPGPWFWWAAAGLALADALHYLMDVI